ncbi:MAG: hypothetical protein M3P95_03595 [Actinomycetota bacterium]|nr:hypothetical protein [Actinomycetota bacterium]
MSPARAAGPRPAQEPAADRLSLRDIYLYLVCLVTLVVSLFAAVGLVRGVVELLYPDPAAYAWVEPGPTGVEVDDAERARQEQLGRESQRRQAVIGLVGSATTLAIAGPVYVYHWRQVQTERGRRDPDAVTVG